MIIEVIRANGERESHELPTVARGHVANLIEADEVDVINLRDGRLMVIGCQADLQVNPVASRIVYAAHGHEKAGPIHGDVAILLDDASVDTSRTVRLLGHLAGYADGPEAKSLQSAAKAIEVSTSRLMAVIRTLSSSMHAPSAEPCATCRYVSRVTGEPFGCETLAREETPQELQPWEYPTRERMYGPAY